MDFTNKKLINMQSKVDVLIQYNILKKSINNAFCFFV